MIWNRGPCFWLVVAVSCVLLTTAGSSVQGAEWVWTGPRSDLTGSERVRRQANSSSEPESLEELVTKFGTDGKLTVAQLQKVLDEVSAQCYSAEELLSLYSLTEEALQNDSVTALRQICPTVLYKAAVDECDNPATEAPYEGGPTAAQVWGYGVLCVTIINLGSLMGACIYPCMNKNVYKLVLTYLIGLAVGTLTGSALLHLIPKTHGLKVKILGNELVWKNSCILLGIYIFFVADRLMKILSTRKESKRDIKRLESVMSVASMHDTYKITPGESALQLTDALKPSIGNLDEQGDDDGHGHSHGDLLDNGKVRIASVAYMIVCGDGLHNFVDGLAIGASFSNSLLSGFSTSIAVACEEFPHELGDFAVLLKSGLSVKQAMGFNFLSSVSCYGGLAVGIVVGRLTSAEPYIFALAAGMFLYIALVGMLPEITNVTSKSKFRTGRELQIFMLQNGGLLSGFGIMILLSVLHPYIKIKV